jgi:enoyl-CoA hydratase/carnithine racemase
VTAAHLARAGRVATITLDRPARRNAVDAATSTLVDRLVRQAEADREVGVIVLTGAGTAFCSGMDLKEAAEIGAGHGLLPGGGFCGITERRVDKPLIAAVNGPAVAGGFELALACDLILAADHAIFGLPEVTRGMVAFTGGVQRLARALPRQAAAEIVLTGQPVTAARLHALGLVARVVPAERLMAEAQALADTILANSAHAVAEARRLLDEAADLPLDQGIALGHARADSLMRSEDAAARIAAYAGPPGQETG